MADFKFSNNELKDRSGRVLGRIRNDEIKDNYSRTIARIRNDEIKDNYSRTIAKIRDVKKEIDGADYLDPRIIAALWICFIQ